MLEQDKGKLIVSIAFAFETERPLCRIARDFYPDRRRALPLSCLDNNGFWNPKGRAPLCLNAAAARSYLPRTIKKTELILAGRTKAQMMEAIKRMR